MLLDLSWSKLMPEDLSLLSNALSASAKNIRNLNLSYNKLVFESSNYSGLSSVKEYTSWDDEVIASKRFLNNIESFLEESMFVNHINFSGMNLTEKYVRKLVNMFKKCKFLMAFHLSDNNITKEPYFWEIMEEFDIKSADLTALDKKSSNPNYWDKD